MCMYIFKRFFKKLALHLCASMCVEEAGVTMKTCSGCLSVHQKAAVDARLENTAIIVT